MSEKSSLNLNTLGGGGLQELFDREVEAVLANVGDPNTDGPTKRKVVLEFTFEPSADRQFVGIEYGAKSTLAKARPGSTFILLENGRMVEQQDERNGDPRQQPLAAVEDINKKRTNGGSK